MDTPKISKLLRLMKLLTGNVSRTIDSLAAELGVTPRTVYRYIDTIREAGFVVNKLYGNVYQMGKVSRGLTDFKRLIYFTDEEAYLAAKMIEGIDNNNALKRDLQRKLASVYDCTSIASYIDNPANAANIEAPPKDVFRMTGALKEQVVLELNTRAKSLLVEEGVSAGGEGFGTRGREVGAAHHGERDGRSRTVCDRAGGRYQGGEREKAPRLHQEV